MLPDAQITKLQDYRLIQLGFAMQLQVKTVNSTIPGMPKKIKNN